MPVVRASQSGIPAPRYLPVPVPPPRFGWRPDDALTAYRLALHPFGPMEPSIDLYA
jgi:hypothetical protein